MITCPLCDTQVLSKVDHLPVPDETANDFYCPNILKMNNKGFYHFSRLQYKILLSGGPGYHYQAIIPPFQVVWSTNAHVQVYKIDNKGDQEDNAKPYYQSKNRTTHGEFIKTCKRFKVLVPFS